ncbi:hypothetical protein HMPREF3104_02990 [Corynebacterium sp. HMSC30G07]|uniref:G5 domain-containing protein n=1 Tax=Corynebacterium sp. HMSC30G07 TaxID=1581072 RepID=UPI0008A17674|nr:G5 domain-containing protein [Corynebacterium sp. HMSC30G07]OFT77149.1 hypothetical protein HMPREF3104_02990 [Corynebacterium sp. HMSC30G07]
MTDSSRSIQRSQKRARTGIAASSVVALALGAFSVVAPGPLAPSAAAATMSGGIREKSGAVEKDAQKASDVKAGSCVVSGTTESGSQAGFSWYTSEPSASSPNKKAWGLSVSFDNSKDRTFADWGFTNSGLMGGYLDKGQIPAMDAGQTFVDKVVTHKADEFLVITGSGRQRNLNLNAKLTDAKVKQFAEATTASPVRYAWQGNYTQDRTSGPFATQGTSSSFTAVVNPWPSENIECNPISVDWKTAEVSEKHVIVPGEESKVGTINIPDVVNGGTDDSMSRMVVEAYDGNGKFIGTSDTEASGGTQLLRIDEETGEIFFTWPEYRGTDLATDKNVNFSVLAKPRTVDQLQAAGENNNEWGTTQVFDSSNSLTRYNKANVIDSKAFSLDDTEYHTPKYDKTDASIISGVDSPTGPLATEPQKVTFTQIPHLIKELKKDKADGGFNANVELDEKYVFDGWTVEMDENYNVTVTAPENPRPGTFARPKVIVEYSNGSTDELELLVIIDPNNTQVTDLVRPGLVKGNPNSSITSDIDLKSIMKGYKPVKPAKYEVDESTVPAGWTVTVDDTGKVTAKADDTVALGSVINPKVKATYPDGTDDFTEATFQVVSNVKVPDYTAVTGKREEEVKLQPVMPEVGLSGHKDDEEPNRYTFPDGTLEYKVGDWTVTIDENTGELSATIPDTALPGAQLTVPVKAHYGNGANPQIATGTINVVGEKSGQDNAYYPPRITKAGEPVSSDITTLLKDPKAAKYALPPKNQWPAGWDFTIDENGQVTATPGEDIPNGTTVTIPVEVTYPDSSTAKVPADFTVVGAYSRANQPSYPTVTGLIGTSVTSKVDRKHISELSEPRFSLITDPKDPDYIAPPRNLTWDQVKIDPITGDIITPIGKNVLPGSSADIPVRVTYRDGSTDFTIATVVAKGKHNQIYEPKYLLKTTKPGEGVDSAVLDETKVPERDLSEDESKRYTVPDTVDGWEVKIDKNGNVTATPPKTAKAGDGIQVPVTVTYLDGSQDVVYAPFKVVELHKDVHEPSYAVEVTGPSQPIKRNVNSDGAPKGSTYSFGLDGDKPVTKTEVDGWTYEIVPETGEVTVTPPADAKAGDKHVHNVTVTYPDGSTDAVPVTTVVTRTNNWESNPVIPSKDVYPGATVTSPLTLEKPENINVAEDNPFVIDPKALPKGSKATGEKNEHGNPTYWLHTANGDWLVGLDDKGNVISTAPETAKPGDKIDVPVIVTYQDGSKDRTTATVNVVDTPTREVPFQVEYRTDDTIPAGEYKVLTKGVPGKEKQKQDGEWERTKEPVTEVVVVGTKPAETAKEVIWKVPIPYPTEVRVNPDLKPGETRVVQEGENGEKSYTAKFTATGGNADVAEDKITKEPTPRIIEYGPGIEDQELTSKTTRAIPFEVEYIVDDKVPAGQTKVDQPGENGEEVITTTQKIVDGKPDGDPTITTERTKEPVKSIIRIGTMTEGTYELEEKLPIPFGTVIEYDSEIPAGEYKVVTEGKPGEKITKITQKIVNSEVVEATRGDETTTTEPVTKVIKVGTKQATATDKVEWKEPIPYPTELRPNDELAPGEVRVVQEGKDGEATYTATFTGTSGEAATTEESSRTEPTTRIVEFGPGLEDDSVVTSTTRSVEFETEIIEDPNLEEGKQVIEQGEFGEEVVTSTQKLVDGKPSGDPVVTTERTKEPKKAIIRVGTKKKTEDPTPPPTDEPTPPVEPKEVELPYTTKIIYDKTLEPGQEIVDQEGANGKVEVTVENGQPSVKVVKEPVEKIIRVGTKPPAGQEWKERIPFEVKVELDPELEAGKHEVAQQGEPGLVQHKSDGTEETLVEKQDHIIRIGTKPVEPADPEDPEQPEVPDEGTEIEVRYTTKVVYDPKLKAGEEVEDVAGKDGKYVFKIVDGKPVAELVEKPVERVVRVGTKPPAGTSWTEEIAYDYEVIEDSELEAGKHEVVQPGKPGERIHREDGSVVEKAPQKLIIKVGTKKKTDEPIPPTDPDNKKGSSEKAERCVANAFATNSPLLWMLPIGLLAGIGYGVNEAFGPQIQAASAEINARFQESMPKHDWGFGDQGQRRQDPEWMRQLQAQADGINRQFAGYSEQLQPLGIALGVIASLALLGSLIAQACTEEGFDNGMTVWGLKGGSSEPGKRPKEWSSQE